MRVGAKTDMGERRACVATGSSSRGGASRDGGCSHTDAGSCDLSRIADSDAVKQTEELVGLGGLDNLGSSGSFVRLLLPAPHHQLAEQHRAWEVLREEGRERGRRGGGGGGGGEGRGRCEGGGGGGGVEQERRDKD